MIEQEFDQEFRRLVQMTPIVVEFGFEVNLQFQGMCLCWFLGWTLVPCGAPQVLEVKNEENCEQALVDEKVKCEEEMVAHSRLVVVDNSWEIEVLHWWLGLMTSQHLFHLYSSFQDQRTLQGEVF